MSVPEPVDAPGLAPSGSTWSQVVVAAGLVLVSGQVAWDEQGDVVGSGSIEAQADRVFTNLERALEAASSSLRHLARLTVYLTDAAHVAAFRAVRDRRLAGCRPASTVVIVDALVDPGLLVEVDAIATV